MSFSSVKSDASVVSVSYEILNISSSSEQVCTVSPNSPNSLALSANLDYQSLFALLSIYVYSRSILTVASMPFIALNNPARGGLLLPLRALIQLLMH